MTPEFVAFLRSQGVTRRCSWTFKQGVDWQFGDCGSELYFKPDGTMYFVPSRDDRRLIQITLPELEDKLTVVSSKGRLTFFDFSNIEEQRSASRR